MTKRKREQITFTVILQDRNDCAGCCCLHLHSRPAWEYNLEPSPNCMLQMGKVVIKPRDPKRPHGATYYKRPAACKKACREEEGQIDIPPRE